MNSAASSTSHPPPWPWANMTVWQLMSWKLTGSSQKSNSEVTRLVHEVIQAPDFNVDELAHFSSATESRRLDDQSRVHDMSTIFDKDGWKETTVEISIPTREKRQDNGRSFFVPHLMYRPLTSVVKAAFSESLAKFFHLTLFKRVWKSPAGHEQQLYDELYTSDAWNKAHDELQKQKRVDNCQLERVIAAMMFWSDSTQLTQFGHASAWPVYLFFGNLSKYIRASPTSGACHPVAFIPSVCCLFLITEMHPTNVWINKLPRSLEDALAAITQKKNNADLLAHCKHELFHAVWNILLDEEFLDAYKNGIVVKCSDGKYRRVFPRIFTYSADYPEKRVLLIISLSSLTITLTGSCLQLFETRVPLHALGVWFKSQTSENLVF